MKRRRVIVVVLAGIVAAVVVAVVWPREREPEYKGKRLSEWLAIYGDSQFGPVEVRQEAREAVNHFGTNALPWLIKWIEYDYPPWRLKLDAFAWGLPHTVRRSSIGVWVLRNAHKAAYLARNAVEGFEVIGAQGSPALPELVRLMRDQKSPNRSANATRALSYLGKDAVAPLLAALTDRRPPSRAWAALALGGLGSNAAPAVPTLVLSLSDQDSGVRDFAARALGYLRLEPELAVPALTNCLGTSDPRLRRTVIASIGEFGTQAVCAIPFLVSALNDPDSEMRSSASNALYRIRPGALPEDSRGPRIESAKPEEK